MARLDQRARRLPRPSLDRGHNPGLSELVERLTEQPVWLPTCGMAEVELQIDRWDAAFAGVGRLRGLFTPNRRCAHDPVQRSMVGVGGVARGVPLAVRATRILPLGRHCPEFCRSACRALDRLPPRGVQTLGHGLGAATTLALMVALLTGVVLLFTPAPRPTSRHVVPSRFGAAYPSLERPF